jgi:F-type H+-transporting ATPase subunit b
MIKLICVSLLLVGNAFAAGDGGHGSVLDLIAPTINFVILFGFILYKIKKPLQQHFVTKSKTIADSIERANVKAREAQVKLETQMHKMQNLDKEVEQIRVSAKNETHKFEVNYKEEIARKSEKLKQDTVAKVEAEKKALVGKLNEALIDQIIANAKTKVKSDKTIQSKINNKITEGIR